MKEEPRKWAVSLAVLVWLVLGCNYDDSPQQYRLKATILNIRGDTVQTDHGNYVSNTGFQVGDTCWIVTDEQGYQCLCEDNQFHKCYYVIRDRCCCD